jgi:hypothetical protein
MPKLFGVAYGREGRRRRRWTPLLETLGRAGIQWHEAGVADDRTCSIGTRGHCTRPWGQGKCKAGQMAGNRRRRLGLSLLGDWGGFFPTLANMVYFVTCCNYCCCTPLLPGNCKEALGGFGYTPTASADSSCLPDAFCKNCSGRRGRSN